MAVVYLEREGQQFGPFSIEQAQSYILEGRFGGQDLGWIDGMQEWLLIAQIPQLHAAPPFADAPYVAAPSLSKPPSTAAYAGPAYPGPKNPSSQNPSSQNPSSQSPYSPIPQAPVFAAAQDFSQSDYAGFWRRAAALMIDSFIVTIVVYFLMFVLALLFGMGLGASGMSGLGSSDSTINAIAIISVGFPALLTICYFAFWNASVNRATPGKMAAGLVVVNAQAQRINMPQAFLREFVKLIGTWFFLLTFVTQPISARRQAIHDFASGTVVLRQNPNAGVPSVVIWIINLCWVAAVLIFIAAVMAFQR